MIESEALGGTEARLLRTRPLIDERGEMALAYDRVGFERLGIEIPVAEEYVSRSLRAGTVRGLHFQAASHVQAKLTRLVRGRVFAVVVDLRAGSPGFGRWWSAELAEDGWTQVYVPRGFAQGYCTLVDGVEITIKASSPHVAAAASGVRWDDPDLAIPWPVDPEQAIVAAQDRRFPGLRELSPLP